MPFVVAIEVFVTMGLVTVVISGMSIACVAGGRFNLDPRASPLLRMPASPRRQACAIEEKLWGRDWGSINQTGGRERSQSREEKVERTCPVRVFSLVRVLLAFPPSASYAIEEHNLSEEESVDFHLPSNKAHLSFQG